MTADDPRLRAFLALAQERPENPYYAAGAYTLARRLGDQAAMELALSLGAARWKPEPKIYMQTEEEPMQPYYNKDGIVLYHGDCREVLPRLPERAALLWTDAAYQLEEGGRTSGGMRGGIFDPEIYKNDGRFFSVLEFSEWVPLAYAALQPDADAFVMTNDKNLEDCLTAMRCAGFGLHNVLVWSKQNKTANRWGMKSVEFICYNWKGRARRLNDCSMGQVFHDRNPVGNKRHPTEKPVSLSYKHITNTTDPGDLVLDPMCGSGSTLVAAKRAGRRAIGIEIDEAICKGAAAWIDTIHADESLEQSVFA